MIIRVSEIPEEGLPIEGAAAIAHPFADPGWALTDLSLLIEKEGEVVLVRGRLDARVPQTCSRCLEPYQVTVSPRIDARFVPTPAGRQEEHELAKDDLETDVYDNDRLDVSALVETETTLGLPMKPLCREDCRGLCPVCGGNRNHASCGCPPPPVDSRWAALRELPGPSSR
ncbi:MAG: DUF177 domain-containing protein [Candidatus Rokubacteria bacterium]|nr:DUF177 domain-containing protein [Candidatus Rokubacteria bacterium]